MRELKLRKFINNKSAVTAAISIIMACIVTTGTTTTLNYMAQDGMKKVQKTSDTGPTIIFSSSMRRTVSVPFNNASSDIPSSIISF